MTAVWLGQARAPMRISAQTCEYLCAQLRQGYPQGPKIRNLLRRDRVSYFVRDFFPTGNFGAEVEAAAARRRGR